MTGSLDRINMQGLSSLREVRRPDAGLGRYLDVVNRYGLAEA